VLGTIVVVTLVPFLMPYTGYPIHLSLSQYVLGSVSAFFVCLGIMFFASRMQQAGRTRTAFMFGFILIFVAAIGALFSLYAEFLHR
jgi:hypothetical protein